MRYIPLKFAWFIASMGMANQNVELAVGPATAVGPGLHWLFVVGWVLTAVTAIFVKVGD